MMLKYIQKLVYMTGDGVSYIFTNATGGLYQPWHVLKDYYRALSWILLIASILIEFSQDLENSHPALYPPPSLNLQI